MFWSVSVPLQSTLLCSREMTGTFGMLHLVLKGNGAPPLPGRVSVGGGMGGAIGGEVIQQHHVRTLGNEKDSGCLR